MLKVTLPPSVLLLVALVLTGCGEPRNLRSVLSVSEDDKSFTVQFYHDSDDAWISYELDGTGERKQRAVSPEGAMFEFVLMRNDGKDALIGRLVYTVPDQQGDPALHEKEISIPIFNRSVVSEDGIDMF